MPVIHDRYRVIRELSSTLYGGVYSCEDMHDKPDSTPRATVAIKQVSLERMTTFIEHLPSDGHTPNNPIAEKQVANLVRTARGHPNLVQYMESFVENQTLYLVMEHCASGDLHNYLSSRKKISCTNALSVLLQVASGLAFLHDHGVAHRDISLENIMLHRGCCKLGDFGLAIRARRAGGRPVGKNYYMAPEIVAGGTYNPKTADVWSLGIVLFVMLTGSALVLLASSSVKSFCVLKRVGVESVLRSWGMASTIPASALRLLSGVLEVDPTKRLTIKQILEHNAFNECLGG